MAIRAGRNRRGSYNLDEEGHGLDDHVSLIVCAAMAGVIAETVLAGTAGTATALLSAVLVSYGLLFGRRLWLASRHSS